MINLYKNHKKYTVLLEFLLSKLFHRMALAKKSHLFQLRDQSLSCQDSHNSLKELGKRINLVKTQSDSKIAQQNTSFHIKVIYIYILIIYNIIILNLLCNLSCLLYGEKKIKSSMRF